MQKIFILIITMFLVLSCENTSEKNNNNNNGYLHQISFLSSTSFYPGDIISIFGLNFGNSVSYGYVCINGIKPIEYLVWNNTEIQVRIPDNATSGKLWVVIRGEKSNEISVTVNSANIENNMILIHAGKFQMGNKGNWAGNSNETPVHTVTISKNFLMSKTEISQQEYIEVMKTNPSFFKVNNLPVESVKWFDAITYCNKRSDFEGLVKCYNINGKVVTCDFSANGYRLPTEAEWEYACKAGTTEDFYNGNLKYSDTIPVPNLDKIAWFIENSNYSSHNLGRKEPNKFGLFDMLGNVSEWCWDYGYYYKSESVVDPKGGDSTDVLGWRLIKGGNWLSPPHDCRSSVRSFLDPQYTSRSVGFRVVRSI